MIHEGRGKSVDEIMRIMGFGFPGPRLVVGLCADCATDAAATTRDRRVHGFASRAGALPGAIERALSGSRRHTRRRRGRLDAPAARVGNRPTRANARVEQHEHDASVGRVETNLGRPTSRVPTSELPCVRRGAITCRFCRGGIPCQLVASSISASTSQGPSAAGAGRTRRIRSCPRKRSHKCSHLVRRCHFCLQPAPHCRCPQETSDWTRLCTPGTPSQLRQWLQHRLAS